MKRLVLIVAAFALAGCNGGTVDTHALTNDESALDSIACEGALLANDVARGRSTTFFAREQAEELRIQSSNFADALSRRRTLPEIEREVRETAREVRESSPLRAARSRMYFYSSGGVEDRWSPKDIGLNRANAIIGYGLGGFLSFALMITGGALFLGHGISPEHLGTIALGAENPLGQIGLLFALVGILFAVGGASIDTVFSGAYNLAQFCGWEWGRYRHPRGAPRFTVTWLALLAVALAIVLTGVDPVMLTEYAVIFSVVALPFTYIPILLVANDKTYMGRYRNGRLANELGLFYLVVIMVVALTAVPLMLLTNVGQN
jgi:hypothetical protein